MKKEKFIKIAFTLALLFVVTESFGQTFQNCPKESLIIKLLPYIIMIIIALIGWYFALLQVRLNVISSYRMHRIEKIMEITSKFCAGTVKAICLMEKINNENLGKYHDPLLKSFYKLEELSKMIIFLSSEESIYDEIKKSLETIIEEIDYDKFKTNTKIQEEILRKELNKIISSFKQLYAEDLKREKSKNLFKSF
jgi:hypothetical protein